MLENSNEIEIRQMQEDDIASLANWVLEIPLWQRYKLNKKTLISNFQIALKNKEQIIIATIDKQVCGFAWLQPKGFLNRSPYLKMIGIKNDYQGLGLGQELISHLEQDKTELFLLVSDFNTNAHKFYKKLGYKQIGTIPKYILDDVDELIFYKNLRP